METLTRAEAGRRLAVDLQEVLRGTPAVMALSPGGVRVASEIARVLGAPLDVIAVARLEVPGRPRSTFGAVADGAAIVAEDRVRALGLPADYVESLVALARREAERLASAWRDAAPVVPVRDREVVLVDDGLSECAAVAAAATALRKAGAATLIYAAPFAARELCTALDDRCDRRFLLFDAGAAAALIRDPDFTQTTRADVGAMVRGSRADMAVVAGG